jgi:hypothetical protein
LGGAASSVTTTVLRPLEAESLRLFVEFMQRTVLGDEQIELKVARLLKSGILQLTHKRDL